MTSLSDAARSAVGIRVMAQAAADATSMSRRVDKERGADMIILPFVVGAHVALRKNTAEIASEGWGKGYCTIVSPIPWYQAARAGTARARLTLDLQLGGVNQHYSVIDHLDRRGACSRSYESHEETCNGERT